MKRYNVTLTKKEFENIQAALAFISCTDGCFNGDRGDRLDIANLARKLNEEHRVKASKKFYLFDSEMIEDFETFQILKPFCKKKK